MRIVTHGGRSHKDEFLSCCLLYHTYGIMDTQRRDPVPAELADPNVIVLDVGLQHNPELMNFDHHQLDRDSAPTCALSQIVDWMGYYLPVIRLASPWFEPLEINDSKGPRAAAQYIGLTDPQNWALTISPVETQLMHIWESNPNDATVCSLMARIGEQCIDYWQKFCDRYTVLNTKAVSVTAGTAVGLHIDVRKDPTLAIEAYCRTKAPATMFTLVRDTGRNRGSWILYRRGTAPLDFSKLASQPEIIFAHTGGFMAKTTPETTLDRALELVALAVV